MGRDAMDGTLLGAIKKDRSTQDGRTATDRNVRNREVD